MMKRPQFAPYNQHRVLGACAGYLVYTGAFYFAQLDYFLSRFTWGLKSFWHDMSNPWTQIVFWPLGLMAIPLGGLFIASSRRFYWYVVIWLGLSGGLTFAGFMIDIWQYLDRAPGVVLLDGLTPALFAATRTMLVILPNALFYLLLRSRPQSAHDPSGQ